MCKGLDWARTYLRGFVTLKVDVIDENFWRVGVGYFIADIMGLRARGLSSS